MLELYLPQRQLFDERTETFIDTKEQTLLLEHSLISLSKWEAKWKKPFLSDTPKTEEESLDYVRCMTVTKHVDDSVYYGLTTENMKAIDEYMESAACATTIHRLKTGGPAKKETVTAEIIYYWMITYNIPFECERWHLNRLLRLIEVCEIKSQPNKKMSKAEALKHNAALNAARRRNHRTTG